MQLKMKEFVSIWIYKVIKENINELKRGAACIYKLKCMSFNNHVFKHKGKQRDFITFGENLVNGIISGFN